jgi:hypothetical protein
VFADVADDRLTRVSSMDEPTGRESVAFGGTPIASTAT